jgi:lysozyme
MNPSSPLTVRGIDVSHYQGIVDWDQVKASGISFAFLKATEGTAFVDPKIARNINECARVGIPYGCYHFMTDAPVDQQVTRFCSIAPSAAPLPPRKQCPRRSSWELVQEKRSLTVAALPAA